MGGNDVFVYDSLVTNPKVNGVNNPNTYAGDK